MHNSRDWKYIRAVNAIIDKATINRISVNSDLLLSIDICHPNKSSNSLDSLFDFVKDKYARVE